MEQSVHNMIGNTIKATDGELGKVHDFFFDDATWTIRYMVAETGNWLSGRKVLISLVALGKPDWDKDTFSVSLTCDQVRKSPDIDTEMPVYPQHEADLHDYYQWPRYWGEGYGGTLGVTPFPLFEDSEIQEAPPDEGKNHHHLRSIRIVTGYQIHATDGEIGHVKDFVVDDENWKIKYLVVDIGNWLPGRKVLLSPKWIRDINWTTFSVYLSHEKEAVKECPDFETLDL